MRARPEWSRHDDVALWGAWKRGELPPLTGLSNAFVNARGPDEAARAYAHAALAVDFLERRFGFAALRGALGAWGRGERGAGVLERMAGMPAEALERAFRAELAQRWARYDAQAVPSQTLARPRADADRAVLAAPGDARAQAQAGLAALAEGDVPAARAALARAQALPRGGVAGEAAVLFLTGELALGRRDADAALGAFSALLALQPPSQDGYDVRVRLALAEIHRKNPAAAEAHLLKAVAFDPSRVEPHALLAELYGDQRRDADRGAEIEASLRLEAQTAAPAKELVLTSARAGRTSRVLAAAPIAIFIDPADPDLHAAYGRALLATGSAAAAAAAFERALLFNPEDPRSLHLTLAEVYTKLGDQTKASAHRNAAR
jgi:tetratricopeptide (TPR) repeat protein